MEGSDSARARCLECYRPQAHCLCGSITEIDHETEVLILQHPRERSHPFNTARVVERCLRRAEVLVNHGGKLERDAGLRDRLEGFGLLYPGADARDLSTLPKSERPGKLVVIDGTWHHARAMFRDIEALHGLPKFTLPAGERSGFKIRKQPQEYCLSTLEAIHAALGCIEPETPHLDVLLEPFQAMQSIQLSSGHDPRPRIKKRRKSRGGPALPDAFHSAYESLVVVYGEVSPIRCGDARPFRGDRPLLTLAAERPATGERLNAVLDHSFLSEDRWQFLGLTGTDLEGACSLASLREAWEAFTRPGDQLAAWNSGTFEHLATALPVAEDRVLLKEVYCAQRPHRGMLEDVVAKEGIAASVDFHNRTQERLANAVAVARLLRRRALDREVAMGLP